jgi:hypothetical protein
LLQRLLALTPVAHAGELLGNQKTERARADRHQNHKELVAGNAAEKWTP